MFKKITIGYVHQVWDEQTEKWVSQEFIPTNEVDWENENGESIDEPDSNPYLLFDMVQPNELV